MEKRRENENGSNQEKEIEKEMNPEQTIDATFRISMKQYNEMLKDIDRAGHCKILFTEEERNKWFLIELKKRYDEKTIIQAIQEPTSQNGMIRYCKEIKVLVPKAQNHADTVSLLEKISEEI